MKITNYKKLFKKEEVNIYTFINSTGKKKLMGNDLLAYKKELNYVNIFRNKKINVIIHDLDATAGQTLVVDYFNDSVELNEEIDISSIELVTDENNLTTVQLGLSPRSYESGATKEQIITHLNNFNFGNLVYEPKYPNRFVVDFPKVVNIDFEMIKTIEKPSFVDGEWQPIHVELFDYVGPSASSKVYDLLNYVEANKYKDVIFIYRHYDIDPTGAKVGKWVVDVQTVDDFNFGYSDINGSGISVVSFTIFPKKCTLIY